MRRGVDYYGVLGVSRDVAPDELKRRFRQLARQFHPDVAADPESAQAQFILVVEAYDTLSDPAKRRAYDALSRGGTPPPGAPPPSSFKQRQIDDWFRHAVHAMEQGDLNSAAAQCRKILATDSDYASAHALLGDVLSAKLEWDAAVVHYSGAVTAAPRNVVYARKLRAALESGQQARAAEDRRRKLSEQRQKAMEALNARHEWLPYALMLTAAWVVVMLIWGLLKPGEQTLSWLPLPTNLALAAGGSGLALGFMLAFVGIKPDPGSGWASIGLAIAAVALFYLSAAAFCVWSAMRAKLHRSLTASYLTTLLLVGGLAGIAALTPEGASGDWRMMALFAGNLIFPLMLIGHKLGRLSLSVAG